MEGREGGEVDEGGGGGGALKNSFWREGLMGKGGQFLEEGSGFLETAIINFTSRLLFGLLFTCRLEDVLSLVIFHSCF